MNKTILLALASTAMLLAGAPAIAQKMEAVHRLSYDSTEQAEAALGALMQDPAMKGARATLYAKEFGDDEASHLIVEDFDDYSAYMSSTAKRVASPGWSRFLLATNDNSEYMGSNVVLVVDDHGAPRYTAGYLAAVLVQTSDAPGYGKAIAELGKALGNPGVLRLVQFRTGSTTVTHAVLIGGPDFKAVNEYLDKLFASDAYADFVKKVGSTRKMVGTVMYRRVATWGD
ncbi:MAG: hypothetical protein AMJ58_08960 [Gammaproteobacteria bacterium SG8_30]|jgi:hypothetical protein|nr:MAG: hypothetical protein AMJ58_08960 [Gammaproteobacteria bacterium SG8_30]